MCSENYSILTKKILSYVGRGIEPGGLCVQWKGEAIKPYSVHHKRKTQHMVGREQLEQINTQEMRWRSSHLGAKQDDVKN